jgi:ABC-type amino acid transport substrate-binding protein
MNKKIIIGIVAVIIIAVGAFVFLNLRAETTELAGGVIEEESDSRPLIVVMDSWEPHAYPDADGVAQGIAVEVVDRVFSRLGIDYEVRFMSWKRVMAEVETGGADMSLSTSYVPERAEFLYYVQDGLKYVEEPYPPYYTTMADTVFFARKLIKDSITFESLEEIVEKEYKVGVIAGYSSAIKLYDTGIDPENVVEYFDGESGFQGLVDGEVEIYFQEKAVGFTILKKMYLTDRITALPQSFFKNPQYLGFSKKSDYPNMDEVRNKILDELRKMHESGEYDEIYNKYVSDENG